MLYYIYYTTINMYMYMVLKEDIHTCFISLIELFEREEEIIAALLATEEDSIVAKLCNDIENIYILLYLFFKKRDTDMKFHL